ncbi:MAG: peptidoglycan D,D-transpeptidase FtsI family protein [Nitratireductor sp.]
MKFLPWVKQKQIGKYSRKDASYVALDGLKKTATAQSRSRITLGLLIIGLVYAVIGGRLVQLGFADPSKVTRLATQDQTIMARRPDLVDRNGVTLATDINTASLYGEPRRIVDVDEAVELLSTVLPELDFEQVHTKLSSKAGFVWLKRELTPIQQAQILELGVPGIGFKKETRRFYPKANTVSHLVGHVNIDNVGIAGAEKYIDDRGLKDLRAAGFGSVAKDEPVKMSIDLRVQHFVHDELEKAMERYKAIAAGAVVLDVNTGEIIAMASLPDYNPNRPAEALKKQNLNRMSAGVFEMGSTFKAFTTAMALDHGAVNMKSKFDATKPMRIGGFTINDFHAQRRVLSVPEVFIYSSNIGTAKMAGVVGVENHKEFLTRMGLLTRMDLELPEVATPSSREKWKPIDSVTISYGHGVTTTPLQTAVAGAALINGGKLIPPTIFPRSKIQAESLAKQVIKPQTSAAMRYLFRLNVESGSGRRSDIPGYWVGGKTGTAEKVVNGQYSSDVRFNAFLAAFPMNDPKYVVLTFIDEPKPEEGAPSATAGRNAAPMIANIVRRAAPILGIQPQFGSDLDIMSAKY